MSRSYRLATVVISACAGLLPLGAAQAAATEHLNAASVGPSQVQVMARGQAISSAEFAELRGEYRLAGGGRLVVEGVRHRPMVALNDRAPVRLVSLGEHRYASADDALQLRFNAHANGNVDAVTITLPNGTH
ncbi:MAG TPA: hypothetical protein VFY73_06910 [Ideonella sp.]|uniref:hypothetical protein n=1 Tax=Ideonella sp. TaxID=1929293 RepID=UPI002E312160|nr:hypothetical protein [Ideonella sp.]HEX5683749.1 hypothetical protein [Ideonella sp.]